MTSSTSAASVGPGAGAASAGQPVWQRLLQVGVGVGLAAFLLGWALPHFAHTTWSDVWAVLRGIPWTTAVGLFGLMLAGLWLYTFTVTGSLPRIGHLHAFTVNVSGSAVGNRCRPAARLAPRRCTSSCGRGASPAARSPPR